MSFELFPFNIEKVRNVEFEYADAFTSYKGSPIQKQQLQDTVSDD